MDEMESFNYIELKDGPDEYEAFAIDMTQDYSICIQFWSRNNDPSAKYSSTVVSTKYIDSKKLYKFLLDNCEDKK